MSAAPASPAPRSPLSIPQFRRLWVAALCSAVGSFLQTVAASWLMLELTGSPLLVAAMIASTTAPLLVLALPAGAWADLVDRRYVVVGAQLIMAGSAASMAALSGSGAATPGWLLVLGLLLGTGMALHVPAWQAMVPDLVPRHLVPSAVALNSAAFNSARAIGPALGGVLVAVAGPTPAFALNALSYTVLAGAVASLRGRFAEAEPEQSVRSAIGLGVRYARFTPSFRWVLAIAAAFAITSAVVQAMLPNLTREAFGGDASMYGLLLGAMGLGAVLGAATRSRSSARLGDRLVPTAIVGFGLAGSVLGMTTEPLVAGGAMVLVGILWVWILATMNATAQLLVPRWVRGRAMSLYTVSFLGITPVGALLAGVVGDAVGAGGAVLILSGVTIAIGLAAFRVPIPHLATLDSPEPHRDLDPPDHPPGHEGGPVLVTNTWTIAAEDTQSFLHAMDELRRVRLRTGAYRWRLLHDVDEQHRMTELFMLATWDDHLRQHRRLDEAALAVIRRAMAFDTEGGPKSRHSIAIDVAHPQRWPDHEALFTAHDTLHRVDGSVPLEREDEAAHQPSPQPVIAPGSVAPQDLLHRRPARTR